MPKREKIESEAVRDDPKSREPSEKNKSPVTSAEQQRGDGIGDGKKKATGKQAQAESRENPADRLEKLISCSDRLDEILLSALNDEESVPADVKILKELTGILKEAVAIKRSLFNLPAEAEEPVTVILSEEAEKYSG